MIAGEVVAITETSDRILRLSKREQDGSWHRLEVFTRKGDGDEWKVKEVGLTMDEIEKIYNLAGKAKTARENVR
jgi:1,2-phenylacetyl-CoA epoxidase PaaB subunit